MVKDKKEITRSSYDMDGLRELMAKKKVKKMGNGGYILLPKELIGKYVEVIYKK